MASCRRQSPKGYPVLSSEFLPCFTSLPCLGGLHLLLAFVSSEESSCFLLPTVSMSGRE